MPEKKKVAAASRTRDTDSMTKAQASKNLKSEPAPKGTPSSGPPKQITVFEAAMKLFHARKFKDARDMFEQAVAGPQSDIAQRARLHIAMCERRLGQPVVELASAEEHYNYGIALINSRKIAEARSHLEKALETSPNADHIHYALALAQALSGDINNAHENLRRAIELEPRNRLIARQDADFASIVNQPPFQALVYPEKKTW